MLCWTCQIGKFGETMNPKPSLHPRLAVASILKCAPQRFLAMFAIKCASWTGINQGTSKRSMCTSIGYDEYESVFASNAMLERILLCTFFCIYNVPSCLGSSSGQICLIQAMRLCREYYINWFHFDFGRSRTIHLLLLVTALGGVWGLEQPNSSCLGFYPAFREFLTVIMESHGSSAAPRHPFGDALNPQGCLRNVGPFVFFAHPCQQDCVQRSSRILGNSHVWFTKNGWTFMRMKVYTSDSGPAQDLYIYIYIEDPMVDMVGLL